MLARAALGAALWLTPLIAQTQCQTMATYSPCEMTFDLNDAEAAAHPNPYATVDVHIEFRSPNHKTYLMPGFWAGGRRMIVRFSATEAGNWAYRISSNIARFDNKTGSFQATASDSAGFIRPANLHHWATLNTENPNDRKPHLWMGDTLLPLGFVDRATFDQILNARAQQKFTHIRGIILGPKEQQSKAWPAADRPNPDYFAELDQRILSIHRKGMVADLVLADAQGALTEVLPGWQDRQRFVRYIVARYAPMNITWQGVREFETYENGRALLKEIGALLKEMDPYNHPRTTSTIATSSDVMPDGWQNFVTCHSSDDQLGSIEHQLYPTPFVNGDFGHEDSGGGKQGRDDVDTDAFRHRLWHATINGQYPTYANTGTDGRSRAVNSKFADSPGARQMAIWFKFFDDTRHWELEPYFDVDGGRAIALEGVEYIVYVDKPQGPIEVGVEKHGYDVHWFNPITGEVIDDKKFKGERWTGEAPDRSHDWVLHIEREGRKESMLRSYKFDSREYPLQLQEPETDVKKTPFTIAEPAGDSISASKPARYAAKLTRETRATRSMMFLWTGEIPSGGQGARVLGTGREGELRIPPAIAKPLPNVLSMRLVGMNANGKIYIIDKVYTLTP
jgi:hypothetical protein